MKYEILGSSIDLFRETELFFKSYKTFSRLASAKIFLTIVSIFVLPHQIFCANLEAGINILEFFMKQSALL